MAASLDPRAIFNHAQRFHLADRQVRRVDSGRIANYSGPAVVLSAFANELYLKALLTIEGKTFPRDGHNLFGLFKLLNGKTQNRLSDMWDAYQALPSRTGVYEYIQREFGMTVPRDLRSSLKDGARAFVTMRYSYEFDQDKERYFIGDLPGILRNFILEARPEWGRAEDIPLTTTSQDQ